MTGGNASRAATLAAALMSLSFAAAMVTTTGTTAKGTITAGIGQPAATIGCASGWEAAQLADGHLQLDAIAEGCDEAGMSWPGSTAPAAARPWPDCAGSWKRELARFAPVTPLAVAQLCDARARR